MPIEVKDLAGLSEPITKLIDVVSNGIGTLYRPRSIRQEADAEAYRTEVQAKAEAKKIMLEGEAKIQILERAKERLVYQELTRQENIEEIAEKSIKYLEEKASEDPVDEDWRTRFFNKAQDISNEDMQEIWARILAGEVSKPGTISYRTLEVISNLSKQEADTFQIACTLASTNSMIWKIKGQNSLDEFGLTYNNLLLLRDAGLIHDNDNLVSILKVVTDRKISIHNIGSEYYQIQHKTNKKLLEFRFGQIAFTTAGKELCGLINSQLNQDYKNQILADREKENYEMLKLEIGTPDNKE